MTFIGFLIFFVTISAVITVAVLIYDVTKDANLGQVSTIIVMFLVIVFLSLTCSIVDMFRRKIMIERPVNEILSATEQITKGDFSLRLTPLHDYEHYDEFDFIIENLNSMVTTLEKNETLSKDFVSNVSHELKTPLSIIKNYSEALSSSTLDEGTRQKYLLTLRTASSKLSTLITNVLQLNKLENNSFSPVKTDFRLDEAIANVLLRYEEQIDNKNIELWCDMDEITLHSSADYLDIVWSNLISNAVKFTPCGGKITLTIKRENNLAVVKLRDTGEGISQKDGERIFEKFYQADTSHSGEGNGLGLALVKKVIDVLGGKITVTSTLGEGTEFGIMIGDVV
jgi:signal transduction histidine kinase